MVGSFVPAGRRPSPMASASWLRTWSRGGGGPLVVDPQQTVESDQHVRPALTGTLRPVEDAVEVPRRDDALGRDTEPLGPRAAVRLHVQLAGSMRVGVDREEAADVEGQRDQLVRGVAALGAAVDLDRRAVLRAGLEHGARVELLP